ncbi:carboxymuconolactone decarboxylase family protein [Stigmatella sp. ncwal1]|uniref:Carboxymuconolactone decarboxylase family protein n=1 Tax=Stigmatella ashevillensis TaxID=2995309 RepID=A0ABT5D727_9BACT|nr:carboxymuconolactone decarboxylase family protein [Stigmatella ashevillena]MDC0709459.1 carboxymuconolactone decarboxylase family protein [Stigmatella ashevillena]
MTQRLNINEIIPGAMKALGGVHGYLHSQTHLPKNLVDLVFLRVSQINGCAYCIDMHSRDLLKGGMTIDKLVLVPVWDEAGNLFDERERAALAWAETVTNVAATGVPEADYAAAAKVFSEKDLADLTVAIGIMNAYNRLGVTFRLTPAAVAA